MCGSIRLKSGQDIESIEEFEDYFKVNANEYKEEYYGSIEPHSCLCPIDLERFFKEHPQYHFVFDWGEWEEV